MKYRKFGNTGFEVSLLGMGCMRLPRIVTEEKTVVDREKAYELIRYAAENGVNYFDTAFTYHSSTSEEVLGEALDGGLREKVKVVTKQPISIAKTQADLRRNLEIQLKKLRTDYLDVYLTHNINVNCWDEVKQREVFKEFEKFRDEGLIKHIGFSYHGDFPVFKDVLSSYPWEMCQIQQNFLDTDKEATSEAIKIAGEMGIPVVIMEPLRGGGLACTPKRVSDIYNSFPVQRSPVEWAFRHLIDYPEVSCILSGMTTLEQLKENIRIFSEEDAEPNCMTNDEKELLKKVKAAYEAVVSVPCTACEYCVPCKQKVDIPGIFKLYNEGNMFENFNQPKRMYMMFKNWGTNAEKCVECGECEKKCPQNIDIIEKLKTSHDALKGWTE